MESDALKLKRAKAREYSRRYRERKRAEREAAKAASGGKGGGKPPALVDAPPTTDPAGAVAAWSRENLKVPHGHPLAGEPMELPQFGVDFLRDALAPGIKEAGLFIARKNAKSAICAVLLLACIAPDGPLRRRGFRGSVASVNREKAEELRQQMIDIAIISGLQGLKFGRVPRIAESTEGFGRIDFLSADRSAGHASGYDICLVDELGILPPRGRDLVSGLLSSTAARDGRLIAISIYGDSALTGEMIARRDDKATVVHEYTATEGCPLDDVQEWYKANPGLGTIKSLEHMKSLARRAAASPAEQALFRLQELNQAGQVSRELVVTATDWRECMAREEGDRRGPAFIGFDIGGSASLTAGAIYWPESGRLECYAGCGDIPDPAARGEADGEGNLYTRMIERAEMQTYAGRVTPVAEFLQWLIQCLGGYPVTLAAADRYRRAEGLDALTRAKADWPVEWRAQGKGRDGSADVREFQKAVKSGRLRPGDNLALAAAIKNGIIKRDDNNNPGLDKSRHVGRIDCLAAAVLAVGIGARATYARHQTNYTLTPVDPAQTDLEDE